jgi:hypothetical protein
MKQVGRPLLPLPSGELRSSDLGSACTLVGELNCEDSDQFPSSAWTDCIFAV